jgi:hypothetical protein
MLRIRLVVTEKEGGGEKHKKKTLTLPVSKE